MNSSMFAGSGFALLMAATVWIMPVTLHGAPGCFSNGRITSSGTWPIQADGYHHVKVQVGTQDGFMWDAISGAIDAWNAKKDQTKVVFETVDGTGFTGTPDLTFNHGDTTQGRLGSSGDPCAFEFENATDPSAPAEIWFNDQTGGVVDAAHALSGTNDWHRVVGLIEHEMGHFLLMKDVNGHDSSTIMTNYDVNNINDCTDAVFDAGYPSNLDADTTTVVDCLKNHTYVLPGDTGGGGGGDGSNGQQQEDDHCELYWVVPVYYVESSASTNGNGVYGVTVTYTLDHYEFYDLGPVECESGYPYVS